MHELAICRSLLAEASRAAMQHAPAEVSRIVVAIGPLSGVEPHLLKGAFAAARAGTFAERAMLVVDERPVIVWCAGCGRESRAVPNALICAHCKTVRVELRSGDELLLERIELTTDDAIPA